MTSPLDLPMAHRLLLAHLQAATSITTPLQNLPQFNPTTQPSPTHPMDPLSRPHNPTTPPTPPPPPFTICRSRSPHRPHAFSLTNQHHPSHSHHSHCKPEPSSSPTPTVSPPPSPPNPPQHMTTSPTTRRLSQQKTQPAFSLHSSTSSPTQPLALPTNIPLTTPPPLPLPDGSRSPSPPYPDNGGWEPSDDEKLASLKLNKKAHPQQAKEQHYANLSSRQTAVTNKRVNSSALVTSSKHTASLSHPQSPAAPAQQHHPLTASGGPEYSGAGRPSCGS